MFSYRHGFHAGNHADVLKHVVLVQLLTLLTRKDKSLLFVDTHAGAGGYALDSGYAAKSAESATGITRLWGQRFDIPAIDDYLDAVRLYNDASAPTTGFVAARTPRALTRYPGSPQLAWQLLREHDRLRLFEAHPTEIDVLRQFFAGAGRRLTITGGDGFTGLKSVLPPPSRRALVLIDPSYEDKNDYRHVQTMLRDALQRFATGTYVVWYPQVQRREAQVFPDHLRRLASGDWFHVTLAVKAPADQGLGLHGSGLFVFNPPWQFDENVKAALPTLVDLLGQDDDAHFRFEFRST